MKSLLACSLFWIGLVTTAHAETYVSPSGFLKVDHLDYDMKFLKNSCPNHQLTVPHEEKRWAVTEFKMVGTSKAKRYYYQICRGLDAPKSVFKITPPMDNVAAFLFEAQGEMGRPHLVWADTVEMFGAGHFESAKSMQTRNGPILILPEVTGGNGGFNGDRYYLLKNGNATLLNTENWKREVSQHLPVGAWLMNDLNPDLQKMSFESDVWLDTDAHATPTGGHIRGTLSIENDQITVKSVHFEPPTTKRSAASEEDENID